MVASGRTIADPQLAPDGTTVGFLAGGPGGTRLLCVPASGGPERIVTVEVDVTGVPAYGGGTWTWTPAGDVVVAARGDLWWCPGRGGPARRLTDSGVAACPAVSPDGTQVAYVHDGRDVAVVPLDAGGPWPRRVSAAAGHGRADFVTDPAWSADGRRLAWVAWDVPDMPWDASRVEIVDVAAARHLRTVAGSSLHLQQPRWWSGGLDVLSDASGWLNLGGVDADGNLRALVAEPFEHGRPLWGGGQRSFVRSPDGERIAFCRNEDGFGRLCVFDAVSGSVRDVGKGVHGSLSWRADTLVALRSGGVTPTQVVAYDTGTWERTVLATVGVLGVEASLVEPELVRCPADDGSELHARLYSPRGVHGVTPLVVWVHGGPTDQWDVTFRPRIAWFVERGWRVLVVDHRGSTGHGRAYTQALHRNWGVLDVDDTATLCAHAHAQGWGEPATTVAMGASAGGFTVLHLLARRPELVAAGVTAYPVCDLTTLAATTHRFEAHYHHHLVGPLPGAVTLERDRSPVTVADRIVRPVLVLHGDADRVVPVEQSARLAERCPSVERHVVAGEGHGWRDPATTIRELGLVAAFLSRHVAPLAG
jgi:dipeptidyl aminopeptidase/acylaminoacyl peptidase